MRNSSSVPIEGSGRHQRSVRNLLLDKKFQLKYTGYLVAIAFVLSGSLGLVLWRTSAQVIEQSERNAVQGQQIVELGEVVVSESRKVSAVVRMNIVKDPIYQDAPELLAAFNSDAKEQDKLLDDQRANLEQQRRALVKQASDLHRFHKRMLYSLAGLLSLLVVAIGAAGIFVTHKIAGPIFNMKRHLREVAAGELYEPRGLRKGDELVEFFDAFREMVHSLRRTRKSQIARLDEVVGNIKSGASTEAIGEISNLQAELRNSLVDEEQN